jgi:putative aldouronate transport system substrate-binding protein
MKKILALVLALAMLLAMGSTALATDKVTYYVRGGSAEYEPYIYPGLVGLLKIQEMADVEVEWTVVCGSGDEIKAQYLAMLSSGKYPDVIQWVHRFDYNGDVSQLYADGIIIELNDVIDKYMPNYKALLEANPDIAKVLKDDEGRYLYFTPINPLTTPDERVATIYQGLQGRKDWLENVGIEELPTTIDGWYEMLKAFRDFDPNGNGEQDEIPFDAGQDGLRYFLPAFDILNGAYINPDTGKVGFGEYTQNYKEFLETMNKWYSEGLIKDIWAEDGSKADASVKDAAIYADLAGSWLGLSNYWEQRLPQVLEKNPNADFVAFPWIQDAQGRVFAADYDIGYGDKYSTVISVDCKNIEAVARLIDAMYTEEGTNCTTWGILDGDPILTSREDTAWTQGHGTYTVDENGVKHETEWANQITENFYDGVFANKYRYAMSHVSFPRWGAGDYLAATREPRFVESSKLWGSADNGLEYPAAIALSVDDQKKAAPQLDDINSYIADMTRKFITGEEPLTNFDNYMDQLQKMGIEDLIAAYQATYDRFLAR